MFTDSQDSGFEAALERTLASPDFRDYLAYDFLSTPGANFNPDFDVIFDAPLTNDDYVLVAERNGNTFFDIIPLDINGNTIPGADIVAFDAPYAWNTNYAPAEFPTQPHWFTVADVENFNVDTDITPIYGFRINNDGQADVKFWGASVDPFVPPASLAGSVLVDDGTPIAGVTITLTGTDVNGVAVTATATTDANGDYIFEDLLEGEYTITEAQPTAYDDATDVLGDSGGTLGDDVFSAIPLGAGVDAVDYDFIETEPALELASIAGSVEVDDGTPIEGVTITLTGTDVNGDPVTLTAVTDANGAYLFEDLVPGTYTVTEAQPAGYGDEADTPGTAGGTPANDEFSEIVLGEGVDAVDYDFVETLGSIAGTVYEDFDNDGEQTAGEGGIVGVTITLTGTDINGNPVTATTTTDQAGDYSFDGLLAGDYTVTEAQPATHNDGLEAAGSTGGDISTDDVIADIPLGAGEDSINNDFGELIPVGSLSGTVIVDDGTPIEGVVIELFDANGVLVASTTTDANGDYSFPDLEIGDYDVVELQPDGYGNVTPNVILAISVPEAGVTDVDFVETTGSLAGSVEVDTGVPIAGVTITLTGTDVNGSPVTLTTTTDADGNYIVEGLLEGEYTITESQPTAYDDSIRCRC